MNAKDFERIIEADDRPPAPGDRPNPMGRPEAPEEFVVYVKKGPEETWERVKPEKNWAKSEDAIVEGITTILYDVLFHNIEWFDEEGLIDPETASEEAYEDATEEAWNIFNKLKKGQAVVNSYQSPHWYQWSDFSWTLKP